MCLDENFSVYQTTMNWSFYKAQHQLFEYLSITKSILKGFENQEKTNGDSKVRQRAGKRTPGVDLKSGGTMKEV